jgi:predicted PurR-regulated permease PerM
MFYRRGAGVRPPHAGAIMRCMVGTNAGATDGRSAPLRFIALVVAVFAMQAARSWLLPICFALLFVVLGWVPLQWLHRRGLPRPLAALAAAAALGLAGWLLVQGLLLSLAEFGAALPAYEARLAELFGDATAFLASTGIDVDARDAIASIEPRSWIAFVQQSVGGALSLASAVLLVAIALVFLLWEGDRLGGRLRRAFGGAWDEARSRAMVADLQRYLGVKTGTSALTGATIYLLNLLGGVPFPGLWGLLAFVLNFIPILGSIAAAVPALLLAIVAPELGWHVALWLAVAYVAINNGISNLLEPVLMGRGIGLPAFVVLLSLVFWGWVWGIGGMFLAVPLTVVAGAALAGRDELPLLRALLLRDEAPSAPAA